MAAGEIFRFLRRLLEVASNALLFDLAADGVQPADQGAIVRAFNAIRRQINFIFRVKFSHWLQNPWVLFGVAHFTESIARECARRALQLFANLPEGASVHWLTLLMLVPGTVIAHELVLFAQGQ